MPHAHQNNCHFKSLTIMSAGCETAEIPSPFCGEVFTVVSCSGKVESFKKFTVHLLCDSNVSFMDM